VCAGGVDGSGANGHAVDDVVACAGGGGAADDDDESGGAAENTICKIKVKNYQLKQKIYERC